MTSAHPPRARRGTCRRSRYATFGRDLPLGGDLNYMRIKGLPLQREGTGESHAMGGARSAAAPSRNILYDHFPNVVPLTVQHGPCAVDGHPDL